MGSRRLFLSPLLFCYLVEDLRSTNKGFFWSNRTFGESRGGYRLGWVNESRSHDESCAQVCLLFCLIVVMVALCPSEEYGPRTVVEKVGLYQSLAEVA